jgi:hypothetical protein
MSEEIVLPFRAARDKLGLVKQVRSTLITTSQRALRTRAMFDRYVELLASEHRDLLLSSVVGVWLPMEAALAHYEACDAVGFTREEQIAIGNEVGDRVHGTFLGVMVRSAKTAGVTPWLALGYSQKLFDRLFEGGGGIQVTKLGPKEARVDLVGVALLRVSYFRNGFRGLYQAGIGLFCEKVYTHEIGRSQSTAELALRISWV